jgi:O-antigen ligase
MLGREGLDTLGPEVLATGGLFGIGPVIVHRLGTSNIPYHNLYFQLLLAYGLFGFAIYAFLFSMVFLRSAQACRARNPGLARLGRTFLGVLTVLILEQMKVNSFRTVSGVLTYLVLFALISALARLAHQDETRFDLTFKSHFYRSRVITKQNR